MPSDSTLPVIFLFTDIEGSTRLWSRDPETMSRALEAHDRALQHAIESHRGRVFSKSGDAFAAAFESPVDAIAAAIDAQRRVADARFSGLGTLRVRMALHAGRAVERDGHFFGSPLNRCARLLELTNGGQVTASAAVAALLEERMPPDVQLVDLGEHRLRDFADTERIFHVSHPDLRQAAALRMRTAPAAAVPLTSFVGRRSEVARVRRLVGESALVTFTGLGGVGKTRLALEVVQEMAGEFGDGAWHVELAGTADPSAVPDAVAKALGVLERPPEPIGDTLIDHLAHRELLLVLDNCEHVIDGVAKLASAARHAAPELKIIATSREPLGVAGETIWAVAPLSTPGTGTPAGASDSEVLFRDRARLVRPELEFDPEAIAAVARICRLLDGIPLAIELAAALTRVLPATEIASRLDDRFTLLTGGSHREAPHHQTLLAAMDWSHDLLTLPEQVLLRRLSVFRNGFTLEAATAVCAFGEIDAELMIPILSRLVEVSLVEPVTAPGSRYRLLETVREYGTRKLAEAGETDDLNRRHARYFLTAGPGGPDGIPEPGTRVEWFAFRHREYDSYRAALAWALDAGELDLATGLAIQLGNYWLNSGCCLGEGNEWLQALITRIDPSPTPELQRVLTFAAIQASALGRCGEAEELALRVRGIADALDDPAGAAAALTIQAAISEIEGRFQQAAEQAEAAYRISADLDDPRTPDKLLHIVKVYVVMGRYDAADELLAVHAGITSRDETEAEYQRRLWRGVIAYQQGELEDAGRILSGALKLIPAHSSAAIAYVRLHLAKIEFLRARPESAAAGARAVAEIARQTGDVMALGHSLALEAEALLELGSVDAAAGALADGLQVVRRTGSPLLGAALGRVVAILRDRRGRDRAVTCLAAAQLLLEQSGAVWPQPEEERMLRHRSDLAARLGRPEFEREWELARGLDPEAARELIDSLTSG